MNHWINVDKKSLKKVKNQDFIIYISQTYPGNQTSMIIDSSSIINYRFSIIVYRQVWS